MKYAAVIFDLGNTLVSYFTREQWPGVLDEAIGEVCELVSGWDMPQIPPAELPQRVQAERREQQDHRVRPLAGRLRRILDLPPGMADGAMTEVCRAFMRPIFACGRRYEETLAVLAELRRRGVRAGILSNTPWGSPGELWREELARHELLDAVDEAVFCTDAGYRKPAPQPFEFIMRRLGVTAGQCLFVGDDPRWDIVGPRGVGMDAVLIDREGAADADHQPRIRLLTELVDMIEDGACRTS
jgi:putative hydrolase of the HAD superfamily